MAETTSSGEPIIKVDRRVARTRIALREALHTLINEKGYDTLTVEEITQRAGVGRATFYLHYKDKEDLLLEQFIELANDRVRLLAQIPITGWDIQHNPAYVPLLLIFENAVENTALYRVVLRGEGAARVTARLRDIIRAAISALVESQGETGSINLTSSFSIDFISAYLAGALIGSITWWLDQPAPLDPVEMTRTFQQMFFPGAVQIFGFKTR